MKNLTNLIILIIFSFLSTHTYSQDDLEMSITKKECCIKSLMQGLKSDNAGLQAGCIYMLGEVCCSKSVIPLMNILHNNQSEEFRILAALSLYKIRDTRGMFAIKQQIMFDESERVRLMCEKFYRAYLKGENNSAVNVTLK